MTLNNSLPDDIIKELYLSGTRISDIAKKFHTSVRNINIIIDDIKIPKNFKHLGYETYSKIKNKKFVQDLMEQCESLENFKKALNCGYDCAQSILNLHGLKFNRHEIKFKKLDKATGIHKFDKDLIVKENIENKLSLKDISQKYGRSISYIKKICKTHNVTLRNNNRYNTDKKFYKMLLENRISELVEIFNKSKSIQDFADTVDVNFETALNFLKEYNIDRKKKNSRSVEYEESVKLIYGPYFSNIVRDGLSFNLTHDACGRNLSIGRQSIDENKDTPEYVCNYCHNRYKVSKNENALYDILKEIDPQIQANVKNLISPREIDIYLPSFKLGIEYCGLYWHSDTYKSNDYHLEKLKRCNDIGIRLIQIFEDEFINNPELVIRKLMHILNQNNNKNEKVYARKCSISQISSKQANLFYSKNHLQGKTSGFIHYGLWFNRELVACITFGRFNSSRGRKCSKDVEIKRYATSKTVVGGFSKLLKHFIKNNEYTDIYSFADRRWSEGNVYERNNFILIKETVPNYWYVKSCKRYHRYNFTKHSILRRFELTDEQKSMSEKQIMSILKFNRIYDCGSLLYKYNKEN